MSNTKQQDATVDGVSGPQQRAIEALVLGKTKADAAAAAGVDRVTIWRWSREPVFEAALNRELWELREVSRARARRLVDLAFDVVEWQLQENPQRHLSTAWEILKATEALSLDDPGSTSPKSLESARFFEDIASHSG